MQFLEGDSADSHSSVIEGHVGPLSGCGLPVVVGVFIVGQES